MFEIFFPKIWYGKTLSCRTSLKSGTAAAVPAVPSAPPMPMDLIKAGKILDMLRLCPTPQIRKIPSANAD